MIKKNIQKPLSLGYRGVKNHGVSPQTSQKKLKSAKSFIAALKKHTSQVRLSSSVHLMVPLVQSYRILIVGVPANAPITMHNDTAAWRRTMYELEDYL